MADSNSDSTAAKMQVNPARAKVLLENIAQVRARIDAASAAAGGNRKVRLIAVSKLKPATDILALHQPPSDISIDPSSSPSANTTNTSNNTSSSSSSPSSKPQPQIHFGENYFQELSEKAALLPPTIKWHFIGALQSNKCKPLAEQIPNLWCVSSVDTIKKAEQLDKGRGLLLERLKKQENETTTTTSNDDNTSAGTAASQNQQQQQQQHQPGPLRIMLQINTSGEASKSGCDPTDAPALCAHILAKCPHLKLRGLMTIGAIARSRETTVENENEDFEVLRGVRDRIVAELGLDKERRNCSGDGEEGEGEEGEEVLELSMGMSADYEGAIVQGSSEVRVGSTLFGERPPRAEAKVLP